MQRLVLVWDIQGKPQVILHIKREISNWVYASYYVFVHGGLLSTLRWDFPKLFKCKECICLQKIINRAGLFRYCWVFWKMLPGDLGCVAGGRYCRTISNQLSCVQHCREKWIAMFMDGANMWPIWGRQDPGGLMSDPRTLLSGYLINGMLFQVPR